jgi:hypothetical protein
MSGIELVKKILASNFDMISYHDPKEDIHVTAIRSDGLGRIEDTISASPDDLGDSENLYAVYDVSGHQVGAWVESEIEEHTQEAFALLAPVFHAWDLNSKEDDDY